MSLLMFRVDPDERATILTDTLVTGPDCVPSQFTAKCRLVPQMRMAVAVTGSGNLLNQWTHRLNDGMIAVDAEMCAVHAPGPLNELWAGICAEHGMDPVVGDIEQAETASTLAGRTTTAYHFGQDRQGRFIWHVFRSNRGFEAERFDQGGFGVKPHPFGGLDESMGTTLDDMIELGCRIRAEQDSLPPDRRIWIGGELWLTVLRSDSMMQVPVHRFDDWLDHWNAMNAYHESHRP